MIQTNRLADGWVEFADKQGNVRRFHLDSCRQEVDDPLLSGAIVFEFSYKDLQTGSHVKYQTPAGEREVIVLTAMADGNNTAYLLDMISMVIARIILGEHQALGYSGYQNYLRTSPRRGRTSMTANNPASPTGKIGVWDVKFVRKYGFVDGSFSIVSSNMEYRMGYIASVSKTPGSLYRFPADFKITRAAQGHDFIDMMSNLLFAGDFQSDLATTEQYRITK